MLVFPPAGVNSSFGRFSWGCDPISKFQQELIYCPPHSVVNSPPSLIFFFFLHSTFPTWLKEKINPALLMFLFSSFLFRGNLEAGKNTIQPRKKPSESLECCFSLAHAFVLALICTFLLIIVNFLHCHEKNTRGWGTKREARKMMKEQKRRKNKKAKAVPWGEGKGCQDR